VVVSSCLTTTPSGYCFTDLLLVLPVLLRPSQAVRRPGTAVLLLLPGLLVLLYCCGRLKLSDDHALRLLLYCGGRLKLSDGRVLLVLLYCWYFITAVAVSSCPTAGYCCAGFPPKGSNCSFLNLGVIRSSPPHAKKYSRATRENQIFKFPGFWRGWAPSQARSLAYGMVPSGCPRVAWL
jgi:hypothetical protein